MAAFAPAAPSHEICLDELSREIAISKQTLVRWTDRGLINAELSWGISDENEEQRLIALSKRTLSFLKDFAEEYRGDTVSRTEARRLLKVIDRNHLQRLIRQGDIKSKKVKGETRVTVSSVEDYLCSLEITEEAEAQA